jgi:hypothetical protein
MDTESIPLSSTIKFKYNGKERVVADPVRKPTDDGHELIVGREILRGKEPTGEAKAYRVDRLESGIQPVE